jgi:hypothetical protein
MDTAPAFASVSEAMDMVQAGLSYLAAADAAQLDAETQAESLRGLEQAEAVATAARASFLSAFAVGKGYSADADYSVLSWLMHRTGITRGAAVGHTAWAKRVGAHPKVLAALAARQVSQSVGRMICLWTGKLPEKFREESDELLVTAAAAGLDLRDLGAMFAEMYERARSELPDDDPDGLLEDRAVRLVTTFQGAGVLNGDLTPECAAAVTAVLHALSAPAGAEDTRTRDQRYHDALQEAMRRLVAANLLPERAGQPVKVWAHISLADLLRLDGSSALQVAGRRRRRGDRLRRGDGPDRDRRCQRGRAGGAGPAVRGTGRPAGRRPGRGLGRARAGGHRQGRRPPVRAGRSGVLPAAPPARGAAGRAEPAAGHRVFRDGPGRDPQRRDAAG